MAKPQPHQTSAPAAPPLQRLLSWAVRVGLTRKFAFLLVALSVLAGVLTYLAITGAEGPDPQTLVWLLLANLVLLLALATVIAREIVRLWLQRRRGEAGARLHVQLVVLFAALAGAPAAIMAVATVLFFNLGVQAWFADPVRDALGQSLAVVEAYLEEHRNNIRGDILAMGNDLSRAGSLVLAEPAEIQTLLDAQTQFRSLSESVVFDGRGRVYARNGFTLQLAVPFWGLDRARAGEVVVFAPEENAENASRSDRVRALARLDGFDDTFLLVGRFVDPGVVAHVDSTRAAVQIYQSLEAKRSGFQITFAVIFVVVALLLLLAAIWMGIAIANRVAQPVGALIGATQRVRDGDLSVRVEEGGRDDDLGTLSRAFNRMTAQLGTQRTELVDANRQIEYRRRFTEAVLANVSAGVVALDARGQIDLPNRSASQLLDADLEAAIGTPLAACVPEFAALLDAATAAPDRPAQGTVQLVRGGRKRSFVVRVARAQLDDGAAGLVATFDDVSELETAQRTAAWADVARRIAHEIKNPLTPIQLSAERLQRKYLAEIKSDPNTFKLCIETIVRQVEDIGRMVDEFASFARMPTPRMRSEDLNGLVRRTVLLQANAHGEAVFDVELPPGRLALKLDAGLIGQALTNLLQNALDAIAGREGGDLPAPHVAVRVVRDAQGRYCLSVADNGKGLPASDRHRLTEPYMTTRAKGTGLGLAIVKKVMEDHGGTLILGDRPGGGAVATLVFPSSAQMDSIAPSDSPEASRTAVS
jgi:two-component system nitrogen regulation sensor histidine kinase NtrY